MLFNLCSNKVLEVLFNHLDFPAKCRLRRCCSRWKRVLSSATVLQTIVFTPLPQCGLTSSKTVLDTLKKAVPHLVLIATPSSCEPIDDTNLAILSKFFAETPAGQKHERRLYLCNFNVPPVFLRAMYKCAAFDWIVLNNMKLPGEAVRDAVSNLLELQWTNEFGRLFLSHPVGVAGLALALSGSHVFKSPLDVIGRGTTGCLMRKSSDTALLDLIGKNMPHLSEQETVVMMERLTPFMYLCDEPHLDNADFALDRLLQLFEPNLAWHSLWWNFDYNRCSPLVGLMLACFTGKDFDSSLTDYTGWDDVFDDRDD